MIFSLNENIIYEEKKYSEKSPQVALTGSVYSVVVVATERWNISNIFSCFLVFYFESFQKNIVFFFSFFSLRAER